MNTEIENTTETAPVAAAATTTTEMTISVAPAAAPARKSRKSRKAVTVKRRKVLAGQHKRPGAPKLEIIGLHTKRVKDDFTKKDIFELNGETISLLTIAKRIDDLFVEQKLARIPKQFNWTGHGRPPLKWTFDLTAGVVYQPPKSKAKKSKVVTAVADNEPAQPAEGAPPHQENVQPPVVENVPAQAEPVIV